MPFTYKKRPPLSDKMKTLKRDIHTLNTKKVPLVKTIYKDSSLLYTISNSASEFFQLLSALLAANKNIPIVGYFLKLLSLIPRSLYIITDPEKSISEKIFSILFIATVVTLSIVAFFMGASVAAIVGAVVAAAIAIVEGVGFLRQVIRTFQTSRAYHKKNAFNDLVAHRQIPEENTFNELFEIRAVELTHLITKKILINEEHNNATNELNFINEVLKKKNVVLAGKDSSAFQLQELYQQRETQLNALAAKLASIDSTTTVNMAFKDIQLLQNQLMETDESIKKLTAPIEKLNLDNIEARQKMVLGFGSFSLAAAGAILAIMGLMMVMSPFALPAVIAPILLGFGIGLAAVSLGEFIVQKIVEHKAVSDKEKKVTAAKETLLEEALNQCDYQLNKGIKPEMSSSHGKYMHELLGKEKSPDATSKQVDSPIEEPSIAHYKSSIFQQSTTLNTESETTPEKSTIDTVNPT